MLSELVALDEDAVVHIPAHLSYEEASTLPCAAVAAWNAFFGGSAPSRRQYVLTRGSGGVSLFALQFAKLFGAFVIATTSSSEKAERLLDLGANHVIDYKQTPNWHTVVRDLTGRRGVDLVVEVGGSLEQSLRAVKLDGQVAFVGQLQQGQSMIDINVIYTSVATVRVIFAGNRAHFVAMNRAITANNLHPVIDRVFDFDDARGVSLLRRDKAVREGCYPSLIKGPTFALSARSGSHSCEQAQFKDLTIPPATRYVPSNRLP